MLKRTKIKGKEKTNKKLANVKLENKRDLTLIEMVVFRDNDKRTRYN